LGDAYEEESVHLRREGESFFLFELFVLYNRGHRTHLFQMKIHDQVVLMWCEMQHEDEE
jgi:hypothetical protein